MRARRSVLLVIAATLLPAAPAAAAPEQVARAEIGWSVGEALDARLARSCVRPRFPAGSGTATGTIDAAARTGGVTLTQGTFRFAKTRRAARGVRSLSLGHLGVQLEGQGGVLVARQGGRTVRIARMARLALTSGPITRAGRVSPNTFRLTLSGTATALAPLRRLGAARCRGGSARARLRAGSPVGRVALSFSPVRATGLAGAVSLRLFLSASRDPATGRLVAIDTLPIAPAAAEGEGIALPVTGSAPLVRGRGDAFLTTGAVATTAGVAFAVGAARVEARDLAFSYAATGRLEGITATLAGVRRPLTTLAADGSLAGEPGAMAAIAAGLGLPSVSAVSAGADAAFTRTGPA